MRQWTNICVLLLCLTLIACDKSPAPPSVSLNDAIVMRKADAVKAHIAAGTDVNTADELGITPLIAAVTSGQLDVVQLLLTAGADINAIGMDDNTPLIYAIQAEQPEIALFLIDQKGIDLNARESHGSTALVEATAFNQMNVVEALYKKGVDLNAPGPVDRTALHIAAMNLDLKMINWLLERGANPLALDQGGYSPICYSVKEGEIARSQTLTETLAVIALFRKNGFTDETIIDKQGTTLKEYENQLKDQP